MFQNFARNSAAQLNFPFRAASRIEVSRVTNDVWMIKIWLKVNYHKSLTEKASLLTLPDLESFSIRFSRQKIEHTFVVNLQHRKLDLFQDIYKVLDIRLLLSRTLQRLILSSVDNSNS